MTPANAVTRQTRKSALTVALESAAAQQPTPINVTPATAPYPRYPSPENSLSSCPHCCHLENINFPIVTDEHDRILHQTAIKHPQNMHAAIKDYMKVAFSAHRQSKELMQHPDIVIWHFTLHRIHLALKNMPLNAYNDHGTGQANRIDHSNGIQVEYCGDFVNWNKTGYGVEKKCVPQPEKNNAALTQNIIEEYRGDFLDNHRHGIGTLIKINHFRYTGGFKDHQFHGLGFLVNDKNNQYEGDFINGLPNGKGTLHYADGSQYQGDFVDNHPQGKGLLHYYNGSQYEGDFFNGVPHGKGTLTLLDGRKLVDTFLDGHPPIS